MKFAFLFLLGAMTFKSPALTNIYEIADGICFEYAKHITLEKFGTADKVSSHYNSRLDLNQPRDLKGKCFFSITQEDNSAYHTGTFEIEVFENLQDAQKTHEIKDKSSILQVLHVLTRKSKDRDYYAIRFADGYEEKSDKLGAYYPAAKNLKMLFFQ